MNTGFLSRLARRARGAESSLRPLIAPLFAPPMPGAQAVSEVEEVVSPPLARGADPQRDLPLVRSAEAREDARPPETRPALSVAPLQPIPPIPTPRPPAQARTPSPPPGPVARAAQPPDIPPPAVTIRHPLSAIDEPSTEATPRRPATLVELPLRAEDIKPELARMELHPEALLLPAQPPQPTFNTALEASGSGSAASGEREEPAPPAIRISIGRVEVRAVQPPAPPGASARPEPHPGLSLDEYLRRLNEENR